MIRGLFFKILLTFWLSSSLIVISGGLITALEFAHERQLWSQSKLIQRRAQFIINRWEHFKNTAPGSSSVSTQTFQANLEARSHQRIELRREQQGRRFTQRLSKRYWKKLPPLLIRDAESKEVFWGKAKMLTRRHVETIEIESNSGKQYLLSFPISHRLSALPLAFKQLFSMRLLAALVLSSLFSLLLSVMLTRPINRLKKHIDLVAEGNLDLELENQLTQRKDEIGSLACSFEIMSLRLNELLESKQKLLNDVSHELRAPLARLQVAATLIEDSDNDSQEQAQLAQRVQLECQRLDHLIGQILSYSKLDHKSRQVDSTNLQAVLDIALDNARFLAPLQSFEFISELAPTTQIKVDEVRLSQIIENLISNSVKYGAGVICIRTFTTDSGALAMSVRDHGPGFEDSAIANLTKPFTRGHQTADSIKGFGLGLSIVQRACELEQCKLTLENHPEGGALATVVFQS